ncbi:MAG: tetratricopeptide repeat protein [Aggregatilineales bacterium]
MFIGEANWEAERQTLIEVYQDKRADRLDAAIDRARAYQRQPLQVKRHLSSWLTLLDHAHDRSDLDAAALELITLLHQPIVNLGYLTDWEPQVRFAIAVCIRSGRTVQQAEFLSRLSNILYWTGRFDEAQTTGDKALITARSTDDPKTLAVCATTLMGALITRGEIKDAESIWQMTKIDPLVQGATGATQAWVMAHLSIYGAMLRRALGGADALIDAANLCDEATHWLKRFPGLDPDLYAQVCRNRGVYYWLNDQYSNAIKLLRRAARLLHQQGNPFNQRAVEGTLSLAYWSAGKLSKAEIYARRSAQAARQLNGRGQLARVTGTLALIALFRGRLIEARRYSERHCRLAEQLGVAIELSRARCNRGIIMLHQGEYAAALDEIDSDRCFLEQNYPVSEGLIPTYCNLARCYVSLGNAIKARSYVEKAMAIAQTIGSPAPRLITLRVLAECGPADDCERQIALLREALTLAENMHRLIDEAGCLLSLAHLTNDESLWERGAAILCQTDATQWLYDTTIEHPPRLPAVT